MAMQIVNLSYSCDGKPIIGNLTLDLPDRGIIGLSGPSGCGKTTLLHLLAGLAVPDSGQIIKPAQHKVSMVFQEDRLLPWLSAANNIAVILPEKAAANRLAPEFWLGQVQLAEWAGHYPAELSGGMKRRVALARALARESDLLLLDEPFTGMDAGLKLVLFELIRATAKDRLVVLVTHDQSDLLLLADQVLIATGPPLQLAPVTGSAERD